MRRICRCGFGVDNTAEVSFNRGRFGGSAMRKRALLGFLCVLLIGGGQVRGEDLPPAWAYPVNPPDFKPPPDDGKPRQVPDSSASYSVAQTRDRFLAPDWHPADHPAMPEIVAKGRKPDVFACGFCHRADGPGGPENAGLAGLPASYIKQQMADFKNGTRKTSVPERGPPQLMIALAKAASEQEVQASAEYFAALKPSPLIKVVETETVPKTYVAGWFLADTGSGEREPIGNRIIEVPADVVQFENRDARSRFIAYVPIGSIKKGENSRRNRKRRRRHPMRVMSRPEPRRTCGRAGNRRPFTELHRPATLRFQARRESRTRQRIDEAGGRGAKRGEHACTGGVCSVAAAGSRRKTMSRLRGCIERRKPG